MGLQRRAVRPVVHHAVSALPCSLPGIGGRSRRSTHPTAHASTTEAIRCVYLLRSLRFGEIKGLAWAEPLLHLLCWMPHCGSVARIGPIGSQGPTKRHLSPACAIPGGRPERYPRHPRAIARAGAQGCSAKRLPADYTCWCLYSQSLHGRRCRLICFAAAQDDGVVGAVARLCLQPPGIILGASSLLLKDQQNRVLGFLDRQARAGFAFC